MGYRISDSLTYTLSPFDRQITVIQSEATEKRIGILTWLLLFRLLRIQHVSRKYQMFSGHDNSGQWFIVSTRVAQVDLCRLLLTKLGGTESLFRRSEYLPLFNKFSDSYTYITFINVFTTAHQRHLFWVRWIQSSNTYSLYPKYILILSSHLNLNLLSGLFRVCN